MARRKIHAGSTSVSVPIFVGDTSSTSGAGLGGLASNSAGLIGEYRRQGQATWTSITLAAGTLGTWSSGGWAADGPLAGAYEVGIPDAALAPGALWAAVRYRGVTNMALVLIEFELDALDYQAAAVAANVRQLNDSAVAAANLQAEAEALQAAVVTNETTPSLTQFSSSSAALASDFTVYPTSKVVWRTGRNAPRSFAIAACSGASVKLFTVAAMLFAPIVDEKFVVMT